MLVMGEQAHREEDEGHAVGLLSSGANRGGETESPSLLQLNGDGEGRSAAGSPSLLQLF